MKPEVLRSVPLLSPLTDAELGRLAPSFDCRTFRAGTILYREDDPGDCFSILLTGEIEIVKALGTADERLLAVLCPGDFLGEMSLLDPGGLRSASVRARSDIELAEITSEAFIALLNHQPVLSLRLLREMSTRLRRSEADTIRDLQAKNQALTQAYLELQQATLILLR